MSFHFEEAVPPVWTPSKPTSLKGKVSTVYDSDVPFLNVQEPTPELSQNEFSDTTLASPPLFHSYPRSGPSHTGKGKSSIYASSPPTESDTASFKTPPHSRRTSSESTPKPSPTRRDSIPIRKSPRVPVDAKPLTVHCESCKSTHSVSISEADRTMVLSCNVVPPPPTPSPTVLELYRLPGYLTLNDKGQIIVSTETELLSYVRKIFAQSDNFIGEFPSTRKNCITSYDSTSKLSASSTPDAARASYALGHSKYQGTYSVANTEPPSPAPEKEAVPDKVSDTKVSSAPRSSSRGPLEPYIPPVIPHGTKPSGYTPRQSGAASPIAFVQTVVPSSVEPPQPSSPKHASATRKASPRNLSPIGIFSDSEVDLPIPVKTESISVRISSARHSRSRSQPDNPSSFTPPTRHELYNQSTEISRELSSDREPPRLPSRNYSVQLREPSPRGRDSSRY